MTLLLMQLKYPSIFFYKKFFGLRLRENADDDVSNMAEVNTKES